MHESDPAGTDWTDWEIDLIVADYFEMLQLELRGEGFVKAHRNASIQKLTGRSRGSIEFKNQNISAVLFKLGRDWIRGYKPMLNFQDALTHGIDRYLSVRNDEMINLLPDPKLGFADAAALFFGPPPKINIEEAGEPIALKHLIRKFDAAAEDARNRALGKSGEERVFHGEKVRLRQVGREDLAAQVRWVSQVEGDGAGYDILSFSGSGEKRLLEVKTTSGHHKTPFYLSENERSLSEEQPNEFRLIRVYEFLREPKAFELQPPLENSVILRPINYRASFGGRSLEAN